VIASLSTPARRIAVAAGLSVLVHILLLWLPQVHIPQIGTLAPPLSAKLEPLPKLVAKPVQKPVAKPRRTRSPHPAIKPAIPEEVADNTTAVTPNQASPPSTEAASAVVAVSSVEAQPISSVVEEPETAPPLPKHAQLTFYVYQGLKHFQIGIINHQLDISSNEYTLKAVARTVGLARIFKDYLVTQTSRGKVGKQGLQPDTFEEEKINDDDKQNIKATFDWASQKLRFSQGGETALPAGTQDILGIFYQLSQLPMDGGVIPLAVSNGKKLEKYELEIGPEEEITTPMGQLRALHLRKRYAKGESGLEIWLGLDYRLFPVKYLLIKPSGEAAGEIVVSDIRVSDE
jgi:hypothetical protein